MTYFIIFWILPIFIGWVIGKEKGYPVAGIVFPLFLGFIGVVIILLYDNKKRDFVYYKKDDRSPEEKSDDKRRGV